jgi:hypothetical protein
MSLGPRIGSKQKNTHYHVMERRTMGRDPLSPHRPLSSSSATKPAKKVHSNQSGVMDISPWRRLGIMNPGFGRSSSVSVGSISARTVQFTTRARSRRDGEHRAGRWVTLLPPLHSTPGHTCRRACNLVPTRMGPRPSLPYLAPASPPSAPCRTRECWSSKSRHLERATHTAGQFAPMPGFGCALLVH